MAHISNTVKTPEIFAVPTHLHLIIWDRLNTKIHEAGLLLLQELLTTENIKNQIIPMIRPLGRPLKKYAELNSDCHCGGIGDDKKDYIIIDGVHTSHCELWIQASDIVQSEVARILCDWIEVNQHGYAKIRLTNEIWEPFGESLVGADYYPKSRDEIISKTAPNLIFNYITEEQIPLFLKTYWGRSSEIIVNHLISGGGVGMLDPFKDKKIIESMMEFIVSDLNFSEYGIVAKNDCINPALFGVSHMPMFALNATLNIGRRYGKPLYSLEQYYGYRHSFTQEKANLVTRPYLFCTRDEYGEFFKKL